MFARWRIQQRVAFGRKADLIKAKVEADSLVLEMPGIARVASTRCSLVILAECIRRSRKRLEFLFLYGEIGDGTEAFARYAT